MKGWVGGWVNVCLCVSYVHVGVEVEEEFGAVRGEPGPEGCDCCFFLYVICANPKERDTP